MKQQIPMIVFVGSCSNDDLIGLNSENKNSHKCCKSWWFIRVTQVRQIKTTLTYNHSIEGESQDPKATETQENKALEMVTKDHLQLVATLYVPPALQRVLL